MRPEGLSIMIAGIAGSNCNAFKEITADHIRGRANHYSCDNLSKFLQYLVGKYHNLYLYTYMYSMHV